MSKMITPKSNTELVETAPAYPVEYEGIYSDGYYGTGSQEGEKHLIRGFLGALRKHWMIILSINLLVTMVTIVYVAQKPDYYRAQARVQVNAENNPAAGARTGSSSIIVNNPGNDPAYFTTQLQILEGAGLSQRVIKTLDLENNDSFLNPQLGRNLTVWQNVKRMFGFYRPPAPQQTFAGSNRKGENKLNLNVDNSLDPDKEAEKLAPLIGQLKRNLTITPVRDNRTSSRETRLIEIEFVHEDPAIAAKIANTIGDVYVLQNLEQKIQTNASAGDFLQKRVADLQSEIRQGEERLINYAKSNQIISLDPTQNTVVQRLSSLSAQLGQAENERIVAQTAYQAALQNKMRVQTLETKDSQLVSLETRLNELHQKLAQLKTEFTDEWYEVVQTKKQIEGVEKQLGFIKKRASDTQISTLEEKLNETIARERELRANFESQSGDVIKQNEAAINYKIIQQEIDTNKGLLDALLERSRENDVILNHTPNNVLVADRSLVPRSPVGPERTKNIVLAFLISLFAGCGLAFLMEWLNDSVHNSDKIESDLGLPLLGAIPTAPGSLGTRWWPKMLSFSRKRKHSKAHYNLSAFERPEFLEVYLQLRTYLMLSTSGGPPQSILVTSGEEGEGKTLTAINLASSLAKAGDKILLIDADLRCPRIHVIKELNNDQGLTSLLISKDIDEKLIDETIHKDTFSNLHILTAGDRTINPANLLCSDEMRKLLEKLAGKYTHIVIDSPPVLYFADSTILSTLVDSVIMVVRDSVSLKQSVLKARKALQNVGAKVVGMVVNGVPLKGLDYSRYYDIDGELAGENGHQTLKLN